MRNFIAAALITAVCFVGIPFAFSVANELSNSTWNETDASNNSAVPNGAPEAMNPSGVNDVIRQMDGALKRWWNRGNAVITTTGSSGNFTYTTTNASFPAAYVQGEGYCFKTDKNAVGADTFTVNSLGAKALYRPMAAGVIRLQPKDLITGQVACAYYDSALNSSAGGFHLIGAASPLPNIFLALPGLPANGTSNGPGSALMMGLGATCKFTPTQTGYVQFVINGDAFNSAGSPNIDQIGLRYGIGSAPANLAADTGTAPAATQQTNTIFNLVANVGGLTVGTQYWFDVALNVFPGGAGTVTNTTCTAMEIH